MHADPRKHDKRMPGTARRRTHTKSNDKKSVPHPLKQLHCKSTTSKQGNLSQKVLSSRSVLAPPFSLPVTNARYRQPHPLLPSSNMVDLPLVAAKMFRKTSHNAPANDRVAYPAGQLQPWAGKTRPITPTCAKLCHARDVPDMDAFSRVQFREDNGKCCNATEDTPVMELTKGSMRNWLGTPIPPRMNTVQHLSPAWRTYCDDDEFMTVHETGTNEFHTLLPIHLSKKGVNPFTPPPMAS